MAWLGFKARSLARDRDNDRTRLERLLQFLDAQIIALEAERKGLRDRYRRATDSAAFSIQALEDGESWLASKVGALTETTAQCEARLSFLEKQSVFLRELRDSVISFMADNRLSPTAVGKGFSLSNEARLPLRE